MAPSLAPLLISKRSLVSTHSRLDLQHSFLEIDNDLVIYLKNLSSVHIRFPELPPRKEYLHVVNITKLESMGAFPVCNPLAMQPISDAQILEIHEHLAHCIEYAMTHLLKASAREAYRAQIVRSIRGGSCKGVVGRLTPPKITGRTARFNGGELLVLKSYIIASVSKKASPGKTTWRFPSRIA